MFFLIRCAFWVGVVFIGAQLLSGGRDRAAEVADAAPSGTAPAVAANPADAAAAPPAATVSVAPGPSVAVLSDVLRLCSEHGSACAAGFSAIDALGGAIGDGLALLTGEDLPTDEGAPAAAPSPTPAGDADDQGAALAAAAVAVAGTLTAADLSEPWLGRAAAIIAGSGAAQRLPPPDPRRDPPPG